MGKRRTYDDIKLDIESHGYVLISKDYKNVSEKIIVQCDKGHEPYGVSYKKWLEGRRCPVCGGKKKLTYEHVKEIFEKEGYALLSDTYNRAKDALLVKCPQGHIYETRIDRFKCGDRCPHCYGNIPLTIEQIRQVIENEGYVLLSNTHKRKEKIAVQCPKGHIYDVRYDQFASGCRCPYCAESKGERRVRMWLENSKISYEQEKVFKECVHKGYLRFDFYIPCMNLCIEYDGEQHYKATDFTNKMSEEEKLSQLITIQTRDRIKNEYCKENDIGLIRIPYLEFDNIESILSNHIK